MRDNAYLRVTKRDNAWKRERSIQILPGTEQD